ncbi:hypothetical protein C362_04064 [Cryptococcus neoformans Bt1]|nr:hypothetical protein C362_04064 [Cryptococcus neoformans var. grubii Bt1]OXG19784.1 hypothetical protein C367_04477 [Cryptococcus neoformans var. grubii Ze90-1]
MPTTLAFFTSLLAASGALAHLQLAWPYALHSTLDPETPEEIKDYSMTSPLLTDGTYPCKGFINNPESNMYPRMTWDAGSTVNYTIAGSATHGGGSCQISMSYDNGTTWSVIQSWMGGCPIDAMTAEVTIPTDAPSGYALFAWGWFNLEGNREMYHNCAPVAIANGGSGLNEDDYPTPFVANAGVNDCVTIENVAVVFPNPGKNVKYGASYATSQPTEPAGFTGTNCVGPGASSSNSSSGSNSSGATASTSAAAVATSSANPAVSVSAVGSSADVSVGMDAQTSIAAATVSTADVNGNIAASSASLSPAVAAASSSPKSCKRKRSQAVHKESSLSRRRERVVARQSGSSGRYAASKASHPQSASKRDGIKRVAASMATHPRAAIKREEAPKRFAASKATHPRDVKRGFMGRLFFGESS